MRVQTWHRLLGSPTDGLDGFDEIFDLTNQSVLREECRVLVDRLDNDDEDKVSVLSDLESLVTHYCKTCQISYEPDNGWLHILAPLIALKLPKNELYAYFSTIVESYVPRYIINQNTWSAFSSSLFPCRQCHFNGVAMHLFRLLLLYHEPELCSFLDSHKISPNLYTRQWVCHNFFIPLMLTNIKNDFRWAVSPLVCRILQSARCAGTVGLLLCPGRSFPHFFPLVGPRHQCQVLEADTFLLSSMDCSFSLLLFREDIMALKGEKEKILKLIADLPQQMEAADIHDFCSLALLYSAQTPYSYKRV